MKTIQNVINETQYQEVKTPCIKLARWSGRHAIETRHSAIRNRSTQESVRN